MVFLAARMSRASPEALDAGADDYVTKPFDAKWCPAGGPHDFVSADLHIDFDARKVKAAGRDVRLTPKEFELLRYLVAHAGRPVRRRELLQAVWGPDYDDQTGYLRVFITHLRKKLEPDRSSPKYILTDHGSVTGLLPDQQNRVRASARDSRHDRFQTGAARNDA